jgi:hypothetical protein
VMNGMSKYLMNMNGNSIFDCCLYCFRTKRLMFIFCIVQNWISCESECKQFFDCCLHYFRTKRLMFVFVLFKTVVCTVEWLKDLYMYHIKFKTVKFQSNTGKFRSKTVKFQSIWAENCEVDVVFALNYCCTLDGCWTLDLRPLGTRRHAVCMSPDLPPLLTRTVPTAHISRWFGRSTKRAQLSSGAETPLS